MPPKPPVARRRPAATSSSNTTAGAAAAAETAQSSQQHQSNETTTNTQTANPNPSSTTTTTTTPQQPSRPARLDTLNRPSIGTPGASRGGRPPVARPKFAGRRSQAARAVLEREQAEQKAKEVADRARRLAKISGRGGRGGPGGAGRGGAGGERGGRSGRGRGGYVGESDRPKTVASGPFSAGQTAGGGGWGRKGAGSSTGTFTGRSGGGGGGRGGGGGGGGGGSRSTVRMGTGGVKQEGERGVSGKQEIDGDVEYISSDEEAEGGEAGSRKNVDNLVVIDLTEPDEDPANSFVPLRIPRQAHRDRTLGLNADGVGSTDVVGKEAANETTTSERRKGKQRAKDVEIIGEKERFHGTYSSSDSDMEYIKQEPDEDDGNASRVQPVGTNLEAPSSPESKRKVKEETKPRTASDTKPTRPPVQTREEAEEWDRQQKDLELLRSELGTLTLPKDANGDTDMDMYAAELNDRRADKVYLFQFPPVLPDLLPVQVKPDPDGEQEANGESLPVEDETSDVKPAITSTDGALATATDRRANLPSGAVGKLRVHKSGKATLDWGGTSLSMGMGTEISFLQDVIIAELPDQSVDVKTEGIAGLAMGMGQVKGKFVVTPNWEELLH